jgi:hypothetical protein
VQGLHSEPESHRQFVFADREPREFAAPSLQIREYSITCPGTNEVLRKFNRDTRWVVVGLLAILLLAALLFVVLFPERHATTADDGHGVAVVSEKGTPLDQRR